jgi:hypothetical protein
MAPTLLVGNVYANSSEYEVKLLVMARDFFSDFSQIGQLLLDSPDVLPRVLV